MKSSISCEITLCLYDRFRDSMSVYVVDDGARITDGGQTYNGLIFDGMPETPENKEKIRSICKSYGVEFDGSEISMSTIGEDFDLASLAIAKDLSCDLASLATAMVLVSNMDFDGSLS